MHKLKIIWIAYLAALHTALFGLAYLNFHHFLPTLHMQKVAAAPKLVAAIVPPDSLYANDPTFKVMETNLADMRRE